MSKKKNRHRNRPYEILEPEQPAEAEAKPKRGRPRKSEKTGQEFPETEKTPKRKRLKSRSESEININELTILYWAIGVLEGSPMSIPLAHLGILKELAEKLKRIYLE
jgi:hypothetical protein